MLSDEDKAREQLISELAVLRQRVAGFQELETERKQAEETLRLQAEVMVNMSEGVYLVGFDDVVIRYTNPKFEEMFGYEPGEIVGKHASIVNAPTEKIPEETAKEITGIIYKTGEWHGEVNNIKKDGTPFWCYANVSVFNHPEYGKVLVAVHTDITERKRAEELLRESEENFRHSLDNSPLGIRIINAKGETIYANRAILDIYGYSSIEEFKSIPAVERHTLKSYAERQERVRKREAGEPVPDYFEQSIIRKNGEVRNLEVFNREVLWGGEKQFQLIYHDITERKQAEEALKSSEEKYRSLFDNMLNGFAYCKILLDENNQPIDFIYLDVNDAFERLTGLRKEGVIGKKVTEAIPGIKESETDLISIYGKVALTGEAISFELYFEPLGKWFTISVYSPRKGYFVAVFDNITERKRAEEALRESEERYRALLELGGNVGEAIVMLQDTEQGNAIHVFVSDEWPRMTGYSRKELLGMSFFDLLHSKDREASLERHRRKIRGEIIPGLFEMSIIRKDGTEVPIELTSAYTTYKGERANVAFIRDITERKRAEEREKELQRELALSSRLASMGELAAGIAHELNNPLTGILGFSERLLRKSTDEEVSRDLERIHDEAERTAKVIRNLLAFARRSETKKEYSDINDIVQEALELRAYELKTGNIEVVADLAPSLPGVITDFRQIQEVFLNIILNAEQAMIEANGGGKLSVKTKQMKNCISVSFTDNGHGIPEEHRDKLFDPFFTTRGEKGGTGLGLSVCHGIVTEHGGKIYAKSKPGKGATFFVELPLTSEKIDEAKVAEELGRQGNVSE